jgi:formylglycine-generating enzyme required for sulfatase activity
MRNGVAIAGGSSAQLPQVGLQSGTYTVVVSNAFASVTSAGVQYPVGTLALVTGGTLPASSPLGAVLVDTFYMGKTEVTWGEWKSVRTWAVANGYPDLDGVGEGAGENFPVRSISWYDVVKWCNARSEKEGKTPVYKSGAAVYRTGVVSEPVVVSWANGYRLPSDSEWEFAARGGTQSQGYQYSGSNTMDAVGWYLSNSGGHPHEVGNRQANELGIFDMSGNVLEWCGSWSPGEVGLNRVIRGGAWNLAADGCSVASRGHFLPEDRNFGYIGFRVAMSSGSEGVLVTGGTLPASSPLGALPVDTFYIGSTEVTWDEWKNVRTWAVVHGYTDLENVGEGAGYSYPVSGVNWYDAVKWCNARSEKEGKTPVYMANGAVYKTGQVTPTEVASANGYRLPSEKEWEFAARGGTQTQGYTYSGSNDWNAVGWYYDNSGGAVHQVGKKQANELGICDMGGNLLEWCGSWYPGHEGSYRVVRGGYWGNGAEAVADRGGNGPEDRFNGLGFRVALSSVP